MDARFVVGDVVRVLNRIHPGHMRTPQYVRGMSGMIIRIVGPMLNPEQLAYGYSGIPGKMLYRVRFEQQHLWPDYVGAPSDTLELEIYEHWLARSTGEQEEL